MTTQIKDSKGRVCKIFTIEYLRNTELTEEDLHYIFDTSSLIYSLIISEIRLAGYNNINDSEIINDIIHSNEWLNKYQWSTSLRNEFTDILTDVFCNIYQVQEALARQRSEMFLISYGLTCKSKNNGYKKVKYQNQ